ncbi:hypothetical protein MMC26_006998 [Xylographa opegraphella]|nr:hypothetical protein [Xylographa opegraphella]
MSGEQSLQNIDSTAHQDQHSDDAFSKPPPLQSASHAAQQSLGASAQEKLHSADADLYTDDAPMTPVTVKAVSSDPEGSSSRFNSDSTFDTPRSGETEKGVPTRRDDQSQGSSQQEVQGADDGEEIKSTERDNIAQATMNNEKTDSDEEVDYLEYTQPSPKIIPKTRFTEVFFASQGDPSLIPPIFGKESYSYLPPAAISKLATTEPRPVPHDLYWEVLRSGYAELPIGPGSDGFYPSARDMVAMTKHVRRVPMQCMAERIGNLLETVEEKNSIIEELENKLENPESAAQSTEIGTLKGSNKFFEDRIRTIESHREDVDKKYAAMLEELQADIKLANKDRQRAEARFALYERKIAAKENTIVELRALSKDAAPNGTIVGSAHESGSASHIKSIRVWQQIAASHEATIARLQNQIIESQTKDMRNTEAEVIDGALRAEYARDKLKDEVKSLEAELDEQGNTITLYEERLHDQGAQVQRLQLEKAQHAQDMRAAEGRMTEYTSRELTLTKDNTNLSNRVKVLNEEIKDRSIELKESDQQLSVVRRGQVATLIENARLKDEIQKVTYERSMLKNTLAQAGDWQREKYTAALTREELKQELAELREATARMADEHRFQNENLEATTRRKMKDERMEAALKQRKVQDALVALRGRAFTNPSEAESEQDLDSAGAVNGGRSLEEELDGSSGSDESTATKQGSDKSHPIKKKSHGSSPTEVGSDESNPINKGSNDSSPIEEAADLVTNDDNSIHGSPNATQNRSSQNNPRHLSKYSKDKNARQPEEEIVPSAEGKISKGVGVSRIRPVRVEASRSTPVRLLTLENVDGAAPPNSESTSPQQSNLDFDNEAQQNREFKADRQRIPNPEVPLRPEEGFKTPQQRPPTINGQALQEGRSGTRRRRTPILNGNVPSIGTPRLFFPTDLYSDDQEPLMSDPSRLYGIPWLRSLNGASGPPHGEDSATVSGFGYPQHSDRTAMEVQPSIEASPPQSRPKTVDPYLHSQQQPTTAAGTIYETDWVRSLRPDPEHRETADPSGPSVPPQGPEPEPEQAGAGAGDPPSPSSSPSTSDPSPPSGGAVGPRDRRRRKPVIVPVFQRVPYRQRHWLGAWEGLVWFLVSLCLLATFLMFMALRLESRRWLAANEGTRQMVYSVQRGGPAGSGLLTWLFDNAFLNVETTSYG